MDLSAQIAEKKRKVEELRKAKLNQSLTQNDPIMKSISDMQKKAEPEHVSPTKQQQSPEKQPEHRKEQPVNLLGLYMEQKRKKLGFCQVDIYGSQPGYQEEKTTFEFGVQCELQQSQPRGSITQVENEDELPSQMQNRRISIKRKPDAQESGLKQGGDRAAAGPPEKKVLSHEEISSILKSNTFHNFFDRSAKVIEKALNVQNVDTLESLMASEAVHGDNDELKDMLTHSISFFDHQYSQNRVVTGLQWSPILPDTFLSSYSQNEEGSINDQVGVVLIWSLQLKSRPEFYCYCQSPVTAAVFHPFSPSLILGGLYNGQLVLWDLRTKQTPEKRTTLSSGGHSYPIFNISVVGSQNAHNIVSVSNDGKLCLWNLSMLNQPQKVVEMKIKAKQGQQTAQLSEINVTSMIFPRDDANNFYVGSEDGSIYHSQLHPNQVQSEGQYRQFEDHQAPITGLSLNDPSQQASPLFQNLMLSSSFDWTVKLWNPRSQRETPLLTFESAEDYIYDVGWNGNHPTLFSSIDGEGYVDLWDVSSDIEAPISRFKSGNNSLNKQAWNKDGQRLALGDSQGNVQILSLDKRALRVDQDKVSQFEAFIRQQR